ncbi:pectinesterase family protein [Massilia pinisoli]|uniref:Pectinesterase family protein n=1 Tax=Massilia pinisoli TaxID=1772194 RepID=A0ABT1ZT49_9BURK|nr:pectinesterase family protein [Massilia pinisoli]MCS0583085.1 pectinesterase family protein [Massilia pinisoli]
MRRAALLACALAAAHAHAQDGRAVREPVLPPACAVLTGAASTSGRDDAARIQAAIDKCAPGHAVVLAASNDGRNFVSGPLQLRDGVTLLVDTGATLYASTDPRLYDRGAGTCGTNDASGRGCRPFITLDGVRGASIMGGGTIDGQGGQTILGKTETWWQIARRAQKEKSRQNVPRLIQADKARDVTLYRIRLVNSPNFHVTLNSVDGFTAWGVTIDTPHDARNTDGIDPISSRNVTIAHSIIRTGDDNVAIKAGSAGPTENVSIVHNRFYSGHGMSIGSETNGGVHRVLVEDLTMDGTTSGLRIKSNDMRGGRVDGIVYRDVCLRDIRSPIEVTTHYEQPSQPGNLVPDYAGIRMERVRSTTPGRILLQGYDDVHPLTLALQDVAIAPASDVKEEHARVTGTFDVRDARADCAARFLPFPAPATRDPRPQLTAAQARGFDYREVLKYVGPVGNERVEPWDPLADPLAAAGPLEADYTVDAHAAADGATRFATVQAAVDRAVAAGGTRRVVIRIAPGTYEELVYVPPGAPPITLDGAGDNPGAVRIRAALDASTTGAAYRSRYAAQFEHAPASVRAMYDALKGLPALQTTGSATVWVRADGFQARNLTIENAYNRTGTTTHPECSGDNCPDTTGGSRVHHQAVALRVDGGDKAQFERVRLLGLQDTLFLNSQDGSATVRRFFHDTHIEGDVDFIFGDTIAVFKDCDIHAIGGRSASYVAAPDTNRRAKYGFVFDGCRFTSDLPGTAATRYYFARQWFHNERCTPYGFIPVDGYACKLGDVDVYQAPRGTIRKRTLETVGKAVILRSRIGPHFERATPWSEWNRNGTLAHRPAQFGSDDYWDNLAGTPFDPATALGDGPRPVPADIYLGEYDNTQE